MQHNPSRSCDDLNLTSRFKHILLRLTHKSFNEYLDEGNIMAPLNVSTSSIIEVTLVENSSQFWNNDDPWRLGYSS